MDKERTHLLVLAGSGLWCLAIGAAPVFHIQPVYWFFATICHQDPSRSWQLLGTPLPVCIRCASIYLGFFSSTLLLIQPTSKGLKLAVVATLVEFALARLIIDSSVLRSLTGLALGAMAAPFVKLGIEEMLQRGEVHDAV